MRMPASINQIQICIKYIIVCIIILKFMVKIMYYIMAVEHSIASVCYDNI